MKYRQIIKFVSEQPWAMLPSTLETMREILAMRANGDRFSDEEIQARLEAASRGQRGGRAGAGSGDGVAVIPVYGAIIPKADMFSDISGATSIGDLRGALASALRDPDVGAIVLDVDSPGGSTNLLPEFASDLRAARQQKPILAVSNTLMASAGYWIASQANEIAVSPSSLTGAIGVIAAHKDTSAADEKDGMKTTLVSAGKYKAEGSPSEPLSDEARGHLQSLVDAAYQSFTGDVAKGRGVTVDDVRGGFGEGRVLPAKAAVAAGLADRVATLEQTVQRAAEVAKMPRNARTAAISGEYGSLYLASLETGAELGLTAGPVAPHSTATTKEPWDAGAQEKNLPSPLPLAKAQAAYAWYDSSQVSDGSIPKSGCKFPHHMVGADGSVGAANTNGCVSAIGVLNGAMGGASIPSGDRAGVYAHVARHLRDAGIDPPPLKSFTNIDIEAAGGSPDEDEALLPVAEALVANGRRLTTAKRERIAALRERCDAVLAAEPRDPATARVAAMRARLRIAETTLRQE